MGSPISFWGSWADWRLWCWASKGFDAVHWHKKRLPTYAVGNLMYCVFGEILFYRKIISATWRSAR